MTQRRRRPRRLSDTFRPSRRRLRRVAERLHRRGRLPCDPDSALDAVVAVHDVLQAEGRSLDPDAPDADATLLRAIEVRDLIRAGVWPD